MEVPGSVGPSESSNKSKPSLRSRATKLHRQAMERYQKQEELVHAWSRLAILIGVITLAILFVILRIVRGG